MQLYPQCREADFHRDYRFGPNYEGNGGLPLSPSSLILSTFKIDLWVTVAWPLAWEWLGKEK